MFSRIAPTLSRTARAAAPRGYATAASSSSSSSAPYFLGAGLAGAGAFWYSTKDQRALHADASAKDTAKSGGSVQGVKTTEDGGIKVQGESALSPDEFRAFEIAEIRPYNHNTSTFVFKLPDGTSSGLTVASALVCKAAAEGEGLNDKGKPIIRPYTPVTAPDVEGKLELIVKHYKGGAFTEYLFGRKVGDKIAFKGPIPKHAWKPDEFESVAFIVGGSGVTPAWQVLQAIDANPNDKTKATLIFANVTEEDILLRKEFEDLQRRKPDQFRAVFVLDKPPSGWKGPTGYVNKELITKELKQFGTGPEGGDKVKVFVCGPPGQMKAISGAKKSPKDQGPLEGVLKELGYTESQVYKF
ncbi:hypothetical protein JCM10207_004803 [Rhodosporidiobolus poonsookiae]